MTPGDISVPVTAEQIKQLASFIMHKHYCENDVYAITPLFTDPFSWIGAGEQEYACGADNVSAIFHQFAGKVPACILTDEEYDVFEISAGIFVCTGRVWISTDPKTGQFLRVHQRMVFVFKTAGNTVRCCHISISNPYAEMSEDDIGFPTKLSRQTALYLQEQLAVQKAQIEQQTSMLKRLSYEDGLTKLYNRNRFNEELDAAESGGSTGAGVAYFDLNGLKEVNDKFGHAAGDDLIQRTAGHIKAEFPGRGYRIGGDEFVVIDRVLDENEFRAAVARVCLHMEQDAISASVGISWRCPAAIGIQFEEADRLMYEHKRAFYSQPGKDRRRRYMVS